MTDKDKRSTYKTTSEADALIERINAARPLDRTTVADAINYALRYVAQHDQEVVMETKARAIVAVVGGDVNECWAWLKDGDGDVMPLEECIEEWREVGATYQA